MVGLGGMVVSDGSKEREEEEEKKKEEVERGGGWAIEREIDGRRLVSLDDHLLSRGQV